ncbi:MAG TPA: hypothetical protein VFW68_06250 [Rhodocyclaceae bacterium]|nr:hypothetical protein [Rhodocyclaceae bacterium]
MAPVVMKAALAPLTRTVVLVAPMLLVACMSQAPAPVVMRDVGGGVEQQAAIGRGLPAIVLPRVGDIGYRPTGPLPVRAINASVQCAFKDEVGTQGHLDLQVENASIKSFLAQVNMPKRGMCSFDLKDFEQTEKLPAAVLASRRDACSVRLWEQGDQLTVAFSHCEAHCTGDAFTYLWPILADRPSGTCA